VPYRLIWSLYTGRWWVGCYIWYSEEGTGRGRNPPSPLLAVPNVTAHRSTASVPTTVLLYNGPLLCDFNVAIKGLSAHCIAVTLQFAQWRCPSVRLFVRLSIAWWRRGLIVSHWLVVVVFTALVCSGSAIPCSDVGYCFHGGLCCEEPQYENRHCV